MDVLIVENDAIVAKVWAKKLSKPRVINVGGDEVTVSYQVRIAESVNKAKEEIKKKLPDLVLLDLRLNGPKHSGLQVYEFIRKELGGKIPIMFITGLAYSVDLFKKAKEYVHEDQTYGLNTSLMEKPVHISDLISMVDIATVA